MASAWGNSWLQAWGNSWGGVSTVERDPGDSSEDRHARVPPYPYRPTTVDIRVRLSLRVCRYEVSEVHPPKPVRVRLVSAVVEVEHPESVVVRASVRLPVRVSYRVQTNERAMIRREERELSMLLGTLSPWR